ncbi:hypothetical protein AVEN_217919-1 [Araneus ventricosus]|uniref:Uncharacterized protein n=1 Tax=Araneus ventricosus TaxID=182803 RepID=A0A4Y2U5W9_ARAVE|nr:hypothetical protein AVEN_217919-1 [Araneus ventricosus]
MSLNEAPPDTRLFTVPLSPHTLGQDNPTNNVFYTLFSPQPHITLNSSKGVITCGRLLNLSNEEITQELGGQEVKDVRRINIRRDGELLPTKHFILTFNTPRLPEYIKAGYVRCSVRHYMTSAFHTTWISSASAAMVKIILAPIAHGW